jgi:hypothetical protein
MEQTNATNTACTQHMGRKGVQAQPGRSAVLVKVDSASCHAAERAYESGYDSAVEFRAVATRSISRYRTGRMVHLEGSWRNMRRSSSKVSLAKQKIILRLVKCRAIRPLHNVRVDWNSKMLARTK